MNNTLQSGSGVPGSTQRVTWRDVSNGSWPGFHPGDGGSIPPPATIDYLGRR